MLSTAEFQLIQTPDGRIIGRLYHPTRTFKTENSKRTILSVSHKGRCITFETSIEDMLAIKAQAQPSYSAAARINTNKLAQMLKYAQRQAIAA